ncbi:uncharacterized protein LOC130622549 isoform X2 [Hydractinia symbiolongicarpus]|uniref:uncharacterized protein LOC130622549 isoform X2 n=1 Tax=Hydractinia symbiolongicarpus TaxID=13093 RepID=UPI00254B1FAD|nr:uncharacterized protein LOC130622549 isoform X2 [Hydractinia symbiolongicarpus]
MIFSVLVMGCCVSLPEKIDANKQQEIVEELVGRSEQVNKEGNRPQGRVMCSNEENFDRGSGDCKPILIAADGKCANEYENFAGGLSKNTLTVSNTVSCYHGDNHSKESNVSGGLVSLEELPPVHNLPLMLQTITDTEVTRLNASRCELCHHGRVRRTCKSCIRPPSRGGREFLHIRWTKHRRTVPIQKPVC